MPTLTREQCRNELQSIRGWNYERLARSSKMEKGGPLRQGGNGLDRDWLENYDVDGRF